MKFSKALALLLVAGMITSSVVSCGNNSNDSEQTNPEVGNDEVKGGIVKVENALDDIMAIEDYDEKSSALYDNSMSDFYEAYMEAKNETSNVSKRYALMAIAEAKYLETALMLPFGSNGGNYAIGRTAPYTVDFAMWGGDQDRFHQIVVTTEPIKSEHRNALKAKWAELKGTGTYEAYCKQYLIDNGYTLKDSYTMAYSSDPLTWDVLASSKSIDSEVLVNTYDSLLEYDCEGTLRPALAESYTVSDDGLTYTFKIREGLIWTDSQGRKVADVKADDFVAGMQHMCDAAGGLEWLVEGVIAGVSDYNAGTVTDFSKVGVTAVDDYTLVYTLEAPTPYFLTMLGYSCFAPMSRDYYVSKGGKFGADYDPSADSYTYAKDQDSIAYCGPYLVTNATEKNTIVFTLSDSYWNKDNVNAKTITWLYNDGTDATKSYNDMKSGVLDAAGLNSTAAVLAKQDTDYPFDEYAYTASTDSSTFSIFYNLNRAAFANANDSTKVVSTQTEEQKYVANHALNNQNFRLALSMGLDRASYLAQTKGEDLKYASMRNSYTAWNLVYTEEDVTVSINGKSTTFPKGTPYGAMIQAQLDADGYPITAYDPNADDGAGSGDYYDGWYNVENARHYLSLALEELKAEGITITKDFPVYLDLPYNKSSEVYTNKANAYKQSIESSLEGLVVINLVACNDSTEWQYSGYATDYGYESNYDLYDLSGWGPDYGDPSSYLDTLLPDYAGYVMKSNGIY